MIRLFRLSPAVEEGELLHAIAGRAVGVTFLPALSNVLLWICAALTVVSGVIYLVQNIGVLKEE